MRHCLTQISYSMSQDENECHSFSHLHGFGYVHYKTFDFTVVTEIVTKVLVNTPIRVIANIFLTNCVVYLLPRNTKCSSSSTSSLVQFLQYIREV